MKYEFSAGGVVFKNDPQKSPGQERRILILVCQHSQHHGWVFPKGFIGDASAGSAQANETKEEAAVREVKEETGIDGQILEPLTPIAYWYVMNGEKRNKTVYYYIMKYLGGDFETRDHEMEAVEWLSSDKVLERLTYESDKKVFRDAFPRIERIANF